MREVLRAIAGLSGVELPGLPAGLEDDRALLPPLDIKTLKDRFRNELEGFSIKTTEELSKRAKQQIQSALDVVQNEVMDGRIAHVAGELQEKLQSPAQIEKLVEPAVREAVGSLEHSFSQKIEHLFSGQRQFVQDKLQGALGAVQAQVNTQVDAEFREILQLPAQIEKLVEPSVKDSAARLEKSLHEKFDRLFTEQQRLLQDEIHGTLSSIQTQVRTEVDAELRARLQNPAEIEKLVEPRVGEVVARLEKSISQKVDGLFAQQQRLVQDQLQRILSSLHIQINTLEQTVQQSREQKAEPAAQLSEERLTSTIEKSLSKKVEALYAEQEYFVQDRLQKALSPIQAHISTLEQALQQIRLQQVDSLERLSTERSNATLEKSLSDKVELLFAQQEQMVRGRLQGTLGTIQVQISKLEETVQELRADSLAQMSAERSKAADDSTTECESGLNNELGGGLDQAAKSVESSFNKLLETFKTQPVKSPVRKPIQKREVVLFDDPAMNLRVQQALDYLDRLGSKSPQPAS